MSMLHDIVLKSVMFDLGLNQTQAEDYLRLPLCEQRKMVEAHYGQPMKFTSNPPRLLSRQQINAMVDRALHKP